MIVLSKVLTEQTETRAIEILLSMLGCFGDLMLLLSRILFERIAVAIEIHRAAPVCLSTTTIVSEMPAKQTRLRATELLLSTLNRFGS